jgi:hypothetical protein
MTIPLSPAIATLLEKVAVDNGFDRKLPREGNWLAYASTQAPLRLCLSTFSDASRRTGTILAWPYRCGFPGLRKGTVGTWPGIGTRSFGDDPSVRVVDILGRGPETISRMGHDSLPIVPVPSRGEKKVQ